MDETLTIGGASGFWGEATHATAQLLTDPSLDVLIYDYLAEITLSIMARARAKDSALGYAPDFITAAMAPNLAEIACRGVRVVSNAGGLNPAGCAAALRAEIAAAGLDLRVAVVEGDDLSDQDWSEKREMFSGTPWPAGRQITSVNAYLGAFPIAAALKAGADIVITGRCADSAMALGAAIWRFGWAPDAFDLLAAGSLAGHILECGPQATGGNFTDWERVGDSADIGYPLADIAADGTFTVRKPARTTGVLSRAAVAEQMLYEIGDPQSYVLPDVICDFSEVVIEERAGGIHLSGARGRVPTGQLKVSATYAAGFRAGSLFPFTGRDAGKRGRAFAETGLKRARARLRALNAPDFSQALIEVAGGRPSGHQGATGYEEVMVKTAVQHEDARAVGLFLKESIGGGLAAPPGLHGFTGAGRPKPSPVVRLFSFLVPDNAVDTRITVKGESVPFTPPKVSEPSSPPTPHAPPRLPDHGGMAMGHCPLEALAWARSGDKGDKANVGVIARDPGFLPWIWHALSDEVIRAAIPFAMGRIDRFHLPGTASMNILLDEALGGGGVASLLNDAQGKAYAQRLLAVAVPLPVALIPPAMPWETDQ